MPILWIHRASACDILVWFPKWRRQEAVEFTNNLLMETSGDEYYTEPDTMDRDIVMLGYSSNLQITLCSSDNFHPNEYQPAHYQTVEYWSPRGYAQVAEDEARDLGLTGEPEGFIPGSSQEIWRRDYRTAEELNRELDNYHLEANSSNVMMID
jgi:hypothetical protein